MAGGSYEYNGVILETNAISFPTSGMVTFCRHFHSAILIYHLPISSQEKSLCFLLTCMFDFGQHAVKHHRVCHWCLVCLVTKDAHYLAELQPAPLSCLNRTKLLIQEAKFAVTLLSVNSPEWRRRGWRPRRTAASLN